MLRRCLRRACSAIVQGSTTGVVAHTGLSADLLSNPAVSAGCVAEPQLVAPLPPGPGHAQVLSSTFGVGDRTVEALALAEDKKRELRHKRIFEDMIVFDGGVLRDHERLGDPMMTRDFIHFALYHKRFGYFPKMFRKYRELTTSGFFDPLPFAAMRSYQDYETYVAKVHEMTPTFVTPTQLFQPYYGWVMAEFLISVYRSKFDPREPLVVYDVGCGTGALALSLLDFLAEHHPAIYERCEYHVIEQNPMLIPILRAKLVHHYHRTRLHNISIINWRQRDPRRCVVLGIELLSCMPHDNIYISRVGEVSEVRHVYGTRDSITSMFEERAELTDPAIMRYMRYVGWLEEQSFHALRVLCATHGHENIDPAIWGPLDHTATSFAQFLAKGISLVNPYNSVYVPTVAMMMLETMAQYMPRHHCFFADWAHVQHAIAGYNGPVIQFKLRLAKDLYARRIGPDIAHNAGNVDVLFPTDFPSMARMYARICGEHKEIVSSSHPEFWRTFGGDKTALFTTRSGFNPLLEDFKDFHVFCAHHPAEA